MSLPLTARAQTLLRTLLLASVIARAARADAEADECSDGRLREIAEAMRGSPSLTERRQRWAGLLDEATRVDAWAAALGVMRRRLDEGHFQTWQLNCLDEADAAYVARRAIEPEVAALDPLERRRRHALRYLHAAWARRQGATTARVPWLVLTKRLGRATTWAAVRAAEEEVMRLDAAAWPDASGSALDAAGRRQAMVVRAQGDDAC